MATTRLLLPEITVGQFQKEVTHNQALDEIEEYLANTAPISIAGTGSITLTDAQFRRGVLNLNGALTGNRTVNLPARERGFFVVRNATSGDFDVTIQPTGGNGVLVPQWGAMLFWMTSTDVLSFAHTKLHTTEQVTSASGAATFDFVNAKRLQITLTENLTSVTLQGGFDGGQYIIEATQDATGSRTITWPSNVAFGTDITSSLFAPEATALKLTIFGFIYDRTADKYRAVSVVKGY